MSSFTIRQYNSQDRERCRSLWKELTEWHREIYEDPTIGGEHPEDYFDKHLSRVGPDNLWVAAEGPDVIGLIGLMVVNGEVEIEPLIITKTHRGKGIGQQLIGRVIEEARKRDLRLLNIKPVARNTQAIKFLYRQGFRNLGYFELFIDLTSRTWKLGPKIYDCDFNF